MSTTIDLSSVYKDAGALLEGHFLLSSGNHSKNYLQSAKVLEDPNTAELLAGELANVIKDANIDIDTVCAPALGGIIAGFALACALDVRSIFAERVAGEMTIRRGFNIEKGEKVLICEDIITTGGSALEAASAVEAMGGEVVGFAALANRGFCKRHHSENEAKSECKLPSDKPFFAIDDFSFKIYEPHDCPMCKEGTEAIKPGSRGSH